MVSLQLVDQSPPCSRCPGDREVPFHLRHRKESRPVTGRPVFTVKFSRTYRAVVAPKVIVTVFPGRTVTITFTSTSTRYQRLNFTANTGESGGQASEFEVFSS